MSLPYDTKNDEEKCSSDDSSLNVKKKSKVHISYSCCTIALIFNLIKMSARTVLGLTSLLFLCKF